MRVYKRIPLFCFLPLLIVALQARAQEAPEYSMSDSLVTDCDGFLFDSGGADESYNNNDNLTFTVESGGELIEVSFLEEVCIEQGFDLLLIYDGTDSSGPLLAEISGAGFVPPSVNATSGAVTFVFTSDASANYCGFAIFWNTIAGPPDPPSLSITNEVACEQNTFVLDFSYPIDCTWLVADSISVEGDNTLEVSSVNVNCTNGTGSTAVITLTEDFAYNCTYNVLVNMGIPDVCDSIWLFPLTTSFEVSSCPPLVNLVADQNEICAGSCIQLEAEVVGCNLHSFEWAPTLPADAGPHEICPDETTTYSVLVTDLSNGQSITESITIVVNNPQIAIGDTTFCQSTPAFTLGAIPPGGTWQGNGILDFETGLFAPDSAQAGTNVIYYFLSPSCYDSILVDVLPIETPEFTAACPGSPIFQLDATPPGGVWDGEFVSPEGLFDPQVEGSYELIYTLDICTDTTMVNVGQISGPFLLDTLCQSNWADTIPFSPLGGLWTGPGIIDSIYGVFDPSEVPGGTYNLLYEVEGCSETYTLTVKEIFTGSRVRSSCPSQDAFIPTPDFSPTGGFWEGDGIIDSTTGLYDPGSIPNDFWTGLVYNAPNGCTDTIFYYNRTTIVPIDTLWWCQGDEAIFLDNESTGRAPFGGQWSGNGVINVEGNDFTFTPELAGTGDHLLVYNANGCADSLRMQVHPDTLLLAIDPMCSDSLPFVLAPGLLPGGTWSGPGISDSGEGLFNPSLASGGVHQLIWQSPAGCNAEVFIEVELFQQAILEGLDSSYCYANNEVPLTTFPSGGVLSGSSSANSFNPGLAGSGTHSLTYSWSGSYCSSDTTIEVFVYPALELLLTASDSIVCPGGGSILTAEVLGGGDEGFYTYNWSDGLFGLSTNAVQAPQSQYYYLSVEDGCSDPVSDSVFIEVLPPISPLLSFSDPLCFDEPGGFVSAEVANEGVFGIEWTGAGVSQGDSLLAPAGSNASLYIEDLEHGCSFDTLVSIPSYSPVSALFSTNPNDDCISWDSQPVEFIDFSQHGLTGLWDFGNGEILTYSEGERVFTSYEQAGNYTITLLIFNEGDCLSSYVFDLCILPPTPLFIPDAFSPNGDGNNDLLLVRGQGIEALVFQVYDQWGARVFESSDPMHGWDGRARGREMPTGVYLWVLQARLRDGSTVEDKGEILLMR